MVVMMVEDATASPVVRGSQEVRLACGCCHRYLGTVRTYADVSPRIVWTRVHCHSCGRWRWFDLSTGAMAERPDPPVA